MPDNVIIADSSCLIALSNIEHLNILHHVYGQIVITPEVETEFGSILPPWIKVEAVLDKTRIMILELELDKGESSAIALALEKKDPLLIIDERKGRNVALKMGIKITGILGVLIRAKEAGFVEKVGPIIDELENIGFRVSRALKENILKKVDEI